MVRLLKSIKRRRGGAPPRGAYSWVLEDDDAFFFLFQLVSIYTANKRRARKSCTAILFARRSRWREAFPPFHNQAKGTVPERQNMLIGMTLQRHCVGWTWRVGRLQFPNHPPFPPGPPFIILLGPKAPRWSVINTTYILTNLFFLAPIPPMRAKF